MLAKIVKIQSKMVYKIINNQNLKTKKLYIVDIKEDFLYGCQNASNKV